MIGVVLVAVFILIAGGSRADGENSILGSNLKSYVEETTAAIGTLTRPVESIVDINSLAAASTPSNRIREATAGEGQGGNAVVISPDLATIQQSSVVAINPASQDYIEASGSKRNGVVEYTVQTGDLISFIASDYGVSIDSILWANNLTNPNALKVGQTLKIPPVSGVIHIVKKGDTIATLAKNYGADAGKILDFNDLTQNDTLQINDELIIPDGQPYKTNKIAAVVNSITKKSTSAFAYLPDLGSYFMLPTTGHDWGIIHGRNGVDIANSIGTPILAAADGVVTVADSSGWNGGFGRYIKISHDNGTETLYGHSSKLLVEVGEKVTKGQKIALMGSTGHSTGPHLHFEVHGARNPLAKY